MDKLKPEHYDEAANKRMLTRVKWLRRRVLPRTKFQADREIQWLEEIGGGKNMQKRWQLWKKKQRAR